MSSKCILTQDNINNTEHINEMTSISTEASNTVSPYYLRNYRM